jgi:hypothetical protein
MISISSSGINSDWDDKSSRNIILHPDPHKPADARPFDVIYDDYMRFFCDVFGGAKSVFCNFEYEQPVSVFCQGPNSTYKFHGVYDVIEVFQKDGTGHKIPNSIFTFLS